MIFGRSLLWWYKILKKKSRLFLPGQSILLEFLCCLWIEFVKFLSSFLNLCFEHQSPLFKEVINLIEFFQTPQPLHIFLQSVYLILVGFNLNCGGFKAWLWVWVRIAVFLEICWFFRGIFPNRRFLFLLLLFLSRVAHRFSVIGWCFLLGFEGDNLLLEDIHKPILMLDKANHFLLVFLHLHLEYIPHEKTGWFLRLFKNALLQHLDFLLNW